MHSASSLAQQVNVHVLLQKGQEIRFILYLNQLIFAGDFISLISPLGTNRPKFVTEANDA